MMSLRYDLRTTVIGIWALLLLVPACYYAGRIQHPSPEDYEKSIGREFAMQLEDAVPMIHDPILMEYVSSIGYRLTKGIADRKFEYKFYIINRDVLNAFSVPGGYIYLYTGLISKMNGEDELAAVLSHEIAHVEAQHFINRQKKASVATLSSLAAAQLHVSGRETLEYIGYDLSAELGDLGSDQPVAEADQVVAYVYRRSDPVYAVEGGLTVAEGVFVFDVVVDQRSLVKHLDGHGEPPDRQGNQAGNIGLRVQCVKAVPAHRVSGHGDERPQALPAQGQPLARDGVCGA